MLHGNSARAGLGTPLGQFSPTGMFGRMFPALKASEDQLFQLGAAMLSTASDDNDGKGDNPNIPPQAMVSEGKVRFGTTS